jgi:hypothetical protein
MPAPAKNDNAAKDPKDKFLRVKVPFTPGEKKAINRAHRGRGSQSRFIALAALAAVRAKLEIIEQPSAD